MCVSFVYSLVRLLSWCLICGLYADISCAYPTNINDDTSNTNDIRKCGGRFFYAIGKDWEFPMAWCITHILCLFIYRFLYRWASIFSTLPSCFVSVLVFPLCRERVRIHIRQSVCVCVKIGTKLIWSRWNVLQCTCDICISTTHRKCFQRNRTTLKKIEFTGKRRKNDVNVKMAWKYNARKYWQCSCLLSISRTLDFEWKTIFFLRVSDRSVMKIAFSG